MHSEDYSDKKVLFTIKLPMILSQSVGGLILYFLPLRKMHRRNLLSHFSVPSSQRPVAGWLPMLSDSIESSLSTLVLCTSPLLYAQCTRMADLAIELPLSLLTLCFVLFCGKCNGTHRRLSRTCVCRFSTVLAETISCAAHPYQVLCCGRLPCS